MNRALKFLLPLLVALFGALSHESAHAAVTILDTCVGSDGGGNGHDGVITATGCDAAGADRIEFFVSYGDGSKNNPATVLWGATPANLVVGSDAYDSTNNWCGVAVYEIISPASTSASVVVSWSGLSQGYVLGVALSGVSSVITPPSTATSSSANPSVAVSGATSGNLIISSLCTDSDVSNTTPAGTQLGEVEGLASDTDHNTQSQTTGTTASWTNALSGGGVGSAAVGYAFVGAGGGGGGTAVPTISVVNFQ